MKGWRALLQCGEHFLYKHENLSLDPTTHTELNMGACVWYPSALSTMERWENQEREEFPKAQGFNSFSLEL